MICKKYNFEVKALQDDSNTVDGYAAVFGNVDNVGDMMQRGAFKRSIDLNNGTFKSFFNHEISAIPLGLSTAKEDDHGLFTSTKFDISNPSNSAAGVYQAIKFGSIKSMSFMFSILQSTEELISGQAVRLIKEVKLHEISFVNFPANDMATITAAKNLAFGNLVDENIYAKALSLTNEILKAPNEKFSQHKENFKALWESMQQLDCLAKSTQSPEPANKNEVKEVVEMLASLTSKLKI